MRNNVLQSSAILDDVSWSKHRHMSVNMNRRRLMDGRGRSHLQWSSYRINANNQDRDNIPGRKHPWAQRSQFVQSDVCLHAIEVIPCVVFCFVSLRIRVIVLFCWLVIQFQYRKPSSAGSQIFSPGPIRSMLFGVGPESLSYDINGLEINQTNNNKKSYSTMWSRILSALNHSDALSWRSRVIRMSFFFVSFCLYDACSWLWPQQQQQHRPYIWTFISRNSTETKKTSHLATAALAAPKKRHTKMTDVIFVVLGIALVFCVNISLLATTAQHRAIIRAEQKLKNI